MISQPNLHGAGGLGADPRDLSPIDRERVTTGAFSDLLRLQSREEVHVEPIHLGTIHATTPLAALLDIDQGDDLHRRVVILRGARTRRALVRAQSLVVIDRVTDQEHARLTDGAALLGDVLGVAGLDRELLSWSVTGSVPQPGGHLLVRARGNSVVTRMTRIHRDSHPIAVVEEWWPRFNPMET